MIKRNQKSRDHRGEIAGRGKRKGCEKELDVMCVEKREKAVQLWGSGRGRVWKRAGKEAGNRTCPDLWAKAKRLELF